MRIGTAFVILSCKNLLLDGINAFNLIPLIEMLERIKHGY